MGPARAAGRRGRPPPSTSMTGRGGSRGCSTPIAWADYSGDSDFDGTHFATDYGYDKAGRLLWQSNPDNPYTGSSGYPSVAYTYTAAGQVETERTYLDLSTGDHTETVNDYDELGQLEQTIVAEGTGDEATTTFTYGPLGRLESQTTGAGTDDAVTTE